MPPAGRLGIKRLAKLSHVKGVGTWRSVIGLPMFVHARRAFCQHAEFDLISALKRTILALHCLGAMVEAAPRRLTASSLRHVSPMGSHVGMLTWGTWMNHECSRSLHGYTGHTKAEFHRV